MAGPVAEEARRIEGIVNDLGEVLGPSGEGYDIDDIPFKDWGDVIRYAGSPAASFQSSINYASIKTASHTPQTGDLETALFTNNLTPTVLMVNGTGSSANANETFDMRSVRDAMSVSQGQTRHLDSMTKLIVQDVTSVALNAATINKTLHPGFTSIVLRNVGKIERGDGNENSIGAVKYADFSGVRSYDSTRTSAVLFNGAAELETLDFSGLESGSFLGIGTTYGVPKMSRLVIGAEFTGGISYIESNSVGSSLKDITMPWSHGDSTIAVAGGATIRFSGLAWSAERGVFVQSNGFTVTRTHDTHTVTSTHDTNDDYTWFILNCGIGVQNGVVVVINGQPVVHLIMDGKHNSYIGKEQGMWMWMYLKKFRDKVPEEPGWEANCIHLMLGIGKSHGVTSDTLTFKANANGQLDIEIRDEQ